MSPDLHFIDELYTAINSTQVNYIYRGEFNQAITDDILTLAETNLVESTERSVVKKKVYHIMVECLQNITKHQARKELKNIDESGIFIIQKLANRYYVTTGNLIESKSIPKLQEKISIVNSLSADELKEYYKDMLITGELSEKGGAGLGLIDMARKSGKKLTEAFKSINDTFSYFYLHTEIPTDKDEDNESTSGAGGLEDLTKLHSLIKKYNILISFNSYFNQESMMSLLPMVEGHIMDELNLKKKIFSVLVEMMQNIAHHGAFIDFEESKKPGVFFLQENKENFCLITGNLIDNSNVEVLKNKIDTVNSMEGKELEDFYNHTLFDFDIEASNKAGLGFIDMRMKSCKKLEYFIRNIDNNKSFFALQISICKK